MYRLGKRRWDWNRCARDACRRGRQEPPAAQQGGRLAMTWRRDLGQVSVSAESTSGGTKSSPVLEPMLGGTRCNTVQDAVCPLVHETRENLLGVAEDHGPSKNLAGGVERAEPRSTGQVS